MLSDVQSTPKLFHAGARHRLYRVRTDHGEFVVKTQNSERGAGLPDASLRHEHELLRHEQELLRGLEAPGVVRMIGLRPLDGQPGLWLADAGASDLAALLATGPLPLADFLDVAVQLAETLAHVHRAHIVHRDIHPGNVVWDAGARRATLVDFALAERLPGPGSAGPRRAGFNGTLAFMAPEQTGRTGRAADARADLYALGATFHALLTGAPPFEAADPMELVHAHIARAPQAAHARNPQVPPALSGIVLKLLEKAPEQRYQGAEALLADLREARAQWLRSGRIAPFPLAARDLPRELHIPHKLYGRAAELRTLEAAFERTCRGGRELVLITGTPGIGKSALVNQLGERAARQGCFYIAGKFDQLQRSVPFSGLAQAFRALVRQLLREPQDVLDTWRERIQAAVHPNGQLLVDLVPDLERILGPQPPLPQAGPLESRNRFQLVLTRFLAQFAAREHPLVLFLDDLQWADAASLQWLQQWLDDTALRHVLLLGAYRDAPAAAAHPLAAAIEAWRGGASSVNAVHLGPLGRDDVARLASEALQQDIEHTQELAELVLRKTAGNPFFVRRLLHLLHAQGLIRFDPEARAWRWDMAELANAPVTDNVLDLMTQAIARLPAATRTLLEIASCIGHRFALRTLAEVSGVPEAVAGGELWPALDDGLLVEEGTDTAAPVYRFVHDRVQQAAYGALGEERRQALHLQVGRCLLRARPEGAPDEAVFDIADQLQLGAALITEPAERLQLAELNLAAGRRAKASAAYDAARDYLAVALRNLPADCWDALAGLAFAVHREFAECAYLTGRHAAADALIAAALAHAPSREAEADLHSLRVLAATVVGDWAAALRSGRDGLAVFGLEWPLEGLAAANAAEAAAVMQNLGGRRIEDLLHEPEVRDDAICAGMRLLSLLGPPAYFSGSEVLTFLVTRAVNLSLRHGPSRYSAYAYVFHGALHNARTGEYDVGYAFGKLALALARRFGDRAEESRTLEVYSLVVHPWKAPLRDSLPLLREGVRAGVESGELAYAAFNLNSVLINGLPAGVPLPALLQDADAAIEFATRHRNRTSIEIALPFRQFARALAGATGPAGSFDDAGFEETRFLEDAKDNQTALGNFWVARLQAAYLMGDHEAAQRSTREGAKHVAGGILGMVPSARHVFYGALAQAAAPGAAQATAPESLAAAHAQLNTWARHCPENFAHLADLLAAEGARLAGAFAEAGRFYRKAIESAARSGCPQDEALAHELRARFFLAEQEPALAAVHLRAARDRYQEWGATAKARALEGEHPEWFAPPPGLGQRRISIDALALIKASQAISAETVPEQVFERILRILVEVAGAQSGALLLCDADNLTVAARIETATGISVSVAPTPLDACADLPSAILRYVARMKVPLVLQDAAGAGAFANDPAVRARQLRAVLCVPLLQQAKLLGLLYLENGALAGAFGDELVETVQVLAAQAVISLENARLHQESRREIEQRRRAEQALYEADRRKDEFLAMLAHELRNPLAPIRSAGEVLARKLADHDGVQPTVAIIQRQVTQLTRLVDDLLDVSRVTEGRIQLDRRPLDLGAVIAHAAETVEPLVRSRRHRLAVAGAGEPLYVDGDFTRLAQCIGNILTNAAKYTEPGGTIRVAARVEGNDAVVDISDSGVGISAQLLPRVFDLFVQGDRTIDRSQGGLGVGLSIVKRLVQMHDGTVEARSEGEGRGSTFTIRLPRIARPAAAAAAATEADAAGRRVLVVDDNEDAANSLSMLLEVQGHETRVAYDGEEALRKLQCFSPELVLLDLGLPGMDGYEIARRLRATPAAAAVRLVALSGYGQPEDRRRTEAAGFDGHLVKPVDLGALQQVLAGLLD